MNVTTTPSGKKLITVIPGDGVGPECVQSALRLIEAAGAPVEWEMCEAGASVFKKGLESGVPPETIESIRKTRVVLKGPLETPVGYGEKSANVTLRKLFETYANVRPVREMSFKHCATPGVCMCSMPAYRSSTFSRTTTRSIPRPL